MKAVEGVALEKGTPMVEGVPLEERTGGGRIVDGGGAQWRSADGGGQRREGRGGGRWSCRSGVVKCDAGYFST
ncbi:hypothetical protein R6Q59_002025 [Mikania micrantha]